MTRHLLFAGFAAIISSISPDLSAASHTELKAFPSAENGMQRWVISLPKQSNEEDWNVELSAGTTLNTDSVNHVWLTNSLQEKDLTGWGYSYYQLDGPAQTASTLMAPLPHQPATPHFVSTQPIHVRYNSRLPIVVYTPQDFEVRYRLWHNLNDWQKATVE